MNLRQNGWLNTGLVMRQKDRQETSGMGKPGALEATYHSLWDVKEGLAMITFKRLYNTSEVRSIGSNCGFALTIWSSAKNPSKAGKTFFLCIF